MTLRALVPVILMVFCVQLECSPLVIQQVGGRSTGPDQIFRVHTLYSKPSGPAVKIQCSLPTWFNETALGKADIHWDNETGNVLTIDPQQVDTGAKFKCSARNSKNEKFAGWDDTEITYVESSAEVSIVSSSKTVLGNYTTPGKSGPLELACKTDKAPISWSLDGRDLADHKHIKTSINNTLVVSNPSYTDVGVYACRVTAEPKILAFFSIEGAPFFAIKHGKYEDSENKQEGDPVKINHELFGNPMPLELKWSTKKDVDSPEEEITDENFMSNPRLRTYPDFNVTNGVLELTRLEKEDRAYYTSTATNQHGSASFTTLVRVKGKLDALWPFLGIVAEVVLLVAIILIYERRRMKLDREADEAMDQKKPLTSANSDSVRQRKV